MLRQLIGQIQEFCALYSFLQPRPCLDRYRQERSPLFDCDSGSFEDSCFRIIVEEDGNFLMLGDSAAKRLRRKRNREKHHSTGSMVEVTMEQRIWKEFPEDLFESVISRVPIATFFRLRSVCQKWNSLPNSESFSQHCAEASHLETWFHCITMGFESKSAVMYDPSIRKWYRMSIPSLKEKAFRVTSAGGLVCYVGISDQNIYVGNPLTNSLRELPPRSSRDSSIVVGMTLTEDLGISGYKVMWLGNGGDYEIYDSLQDSWTKPETLSSSINLPLLLNFGSKTISVDQTLYFLRTSPNGVVSYNVVSGVWKQFNIPSPPNVKYCTLAECRGRIMLVGLLTKNAATCVTIWELQKMTLLWKEVDRMPNIWCLEFYGRSVWMTCLGNQGVFMLNLRSDQVNRLVIYDAYAREWRKVPGCAFPFGKKISCGTAFHPCRTANV